MAVLAPRTRYLLRHLRRTPFHPQWLLPNDTSERHFLGMAKGSVLDVGCADRRVQQVLPKECQYIGLDYPLTGVELYGARPDVLADAARLPLADESIDTILMLDVIEHLRYPVRALQESQRVLARGGRLFISVPFLYPIHDAPHDYQRLTIHGLMRDIEEAGLVMEWIETNRGSAASVGLLVCLAVCGSMHEAWIRRSAWVIAAPVFLALVPVANIIAWMAEKCLPSWPRLTSGYRLVAVKP